MKNRLLETLVLSTLLGAPLIVMAEPGQFIVTPFYGYQQFDSELHGWDGQSLWGIGGEYQFNERFGTELDYAHTFSNMEVGKPKTPADYDRVSLDGIYYFNRMSEMVEPYLKLGVGHARYRYSHGISEGQATDMDAGLGVRFNVAERVSLRLEAKALHEFDDNLTHGLYILGIGYAFGGAEKPTHVAAAPVAVAAPAHCPDADHDGVCDADDQCPNTPAGKRVGPGGCDCDYTLTTHFAFDSAVLSDEDKAQLDKLAHVLTNPKLHFIAGEIDGYTDATGKAEYNQKLSERRARAVGDYLQSKGVATGSNWVAKGFGEEDPIADNNSKEGREQNRRVIIRRSDCPAR